MDDAHKVDFFTPSKEAISKWQSGIDTALSDANAKPSDLLSMGELPPLYARLGLKDKTLNANKRTLLKALGQDKTAKNIHNVKWETLDALLEKIHDPIAVFKSLSTSKNPDGYVVVIDDADNNGDQIVAILSPSKIGNGYTLIPSVYGRRDFDNFVRNTEKEGKILYINDSTPAVGKQQLHPLPAESATDTNILHKSEIVNSNSENSQETPDFNPPISIRHIQSAEKRCFRYPA